MKDLFSSNSDAYAQYRPGYPNEVFDWMCTLITHKRNVWDCGTGNGQAAIHLAERFNKVYATDMSPRQLEQAYRANSIFYSCQPAEKTDFPNALFDLVVSAQAVHWFRFDAFYNEVKRVAAPGACICLMGYNRPRVTKEVDAVIDYLYHDILGEWWDTERRYVDDEYRSMPFPFNEIKPPRFCHKVSWTMAQLTGYLGTWSALKKYVTAHANNPIPDIQKQIEKYWPHETLMEVTFPLFIRAGRI